MLFLDSSSIYQFIKRVKQMKVENVTVKELQDERSEVESLSMIQVSEDSALIGDAIARRHWHLLT
jgi:hypothetical protein